MTNTQIETKIAALRGTLYGEYYRTIVREEQAKAAAAKTK